jgi:plasmid stabilization system protein ParE
MKARLLPSAKRELSNAVNFCEVARPGLGIEFIGEFKKAVETIFENTRIGPVVVETRSGVLQEFILSRFPYRLIYSIETDAILIIAVAHQHRQPLFKYDRTERPLAPARRALLSPETGANVNLFAVSAGAIPRTLMFGPNTRIETSRYAANAHASAVHCLHKSRHASLTSVHICTYDDSRGFSMRSGQGAGQLAEAWG